MRKICHCYRNVKLNLNKAHAYNDCMLCTSYTRAYVIFAKPASLQDLINLLVPADSQERR